MGAVRGLSLSLSLSFSSFVHPARERGEKSFRGELLSPPVVVVVLIYFSFFVCFALLLTIRLLLTAIALSSLCFCSPQIRRRDSIKFATEIDGKKGTHTIHTRARACIVRRTSLLIVVIVI